MNLFFWRKPNNYYAACMKAADHIERNPSAYDFRSNLNPSSGGPGCMIAWMAHFVEHRKYNSFYISSAYRTFGYHGLDEVFEDFKIGIPIALYASAVADNNARSAAQVIRAYAARKYPQPLRAVKPPDWYAIAARQTIPQGRIASPEYA